MAEPRAELWRNPTELRVGELGGRKGRERGKRNSSGWKRGRKLRKDGPFVFTTRHTRWNAIHSALARNCYRLWCSLSKHIHFHTCSYFPGLVSCAAGLILIHGWCWDRRRPCVSYLGAEGASENGGFLSFDIFKSKSLLSGFCENTTCWAW